MDGALLSVIFYVIIIILGTVVIISSIKAIRRGHREQRMPPMITPDVQTRIQTFLNAHPGKPIQAIKLLREHVPGLGLKEAKDAVDQMIEGTFQPAQVSGGAKATTDRRPSLADRARVLKSEGRIEEAVFLVRDETGMSEEDAEVFVGIL